MQNVNCLPFDIDGDQVFKLRYDASSPASSTSDGRPWNAYFNSKRSGFHGIRRRASCKGSPKCPNPMCWYKRQYKKENRVNFEQRNGIMVCHSCNTEVELVSCPAVKVWEVSEDKQWVTVYHHRKHTCIAVDKGISKEMKDEAVSAFQKSRQLKPQRYVNDQIISAIDEGKSPEEVRKVAESLISSAAMSNIKATARAEMDSCGHNFDAVGKYRENVCQKLNDPFLIYKVHNKSPDPGKPSFVFKSSREQLQIAVDMDRHGTNPLSEEYCHLDGNHKRCAGFKTITLWMYHPFLRQMCKIATMEAESENTLSMTMFWDVLNEAIREHTGDGNSRFRPYGYMMDEAGAFWASIAAVQGDEDFQRSVSCEKHFDFTVARQEKTLVGEDVKSEFKFLCDSLQKAETPLVFQKASERMEEFIQTHSHLRSWWNWWQKRQSHVFRAFKPLHNVPKTNHAEMGHSRWVKIGAVNLSLIDACREDVAESVKLAAALRAYGSGAFKGGEGPGSAELRKRRYAEQNKRADAYIAELNEVMQANPAVMTSRVTDGFIDPTSSHRHDPVKKADNRNKSRGAPYRAQRSKAFLRSLDIAKKTKSSFTLQKKVVTNEKIEVELRHFTGKNQKVTISSYPECLDCAYCTRQNLCSHIVWVYLNVCKLPEANPILQQRALTSEEVAQVVSSVSTTPTSFRSSAPSGGAVLDPQPGCSGMTMPNPSSSASSSGSQNLCSLSSNPQSSKSSSHSAKETWELIRYEGVRKGTRLHCRNPTCKVEIHDGALVIVAHAMWSPPHLNSKGQKFYVPSKFYFCLSSACCKHQPSGSNLLPPEEITISEALLQDLKSHEYEQLSCLGLPFMW